jgi:hypothetical protein
MMFALRSASKGIARDQTKIALFCEHFAAIRDVVTTGGAPRRRGNTCSIDMGCLRLLQ